MRIKTNMSLHPARDEKEAKKLRDAIEKCGKNMGPHDYIAIEWTTNENIKRVTRFICRVCFCNVNTSTLIATYSDVSVI